MWLTNFVKIYIQFVLGMGLIPNQLIFSIIMVLLLHNKKDKWWVSLLEMLAGLVFVVLFETTLYTIAELPYSGSFITYMGFPLLIEEIIYVLYCIFVRKIEWIKTLVIGLSFFSLIYPVYLFAGWVGSCQTYQWHLDTNFNFTLWITLFLSTLSAVFMLKFDPNKFDHQPKHSIIMSTVLFAFELATLQVIRMKLLSYVKDKRELFLYIYAFFILLSFFTYFSLYLNAREYEKQLEAESISQSLKSDEQFIRMSQENYDNMRKLRHDIKNQYSVMKMLLEDGKYKELEEFFDEYTEKYRAVLTYSNCGNKVVDNILNLEKMKSSECDISLDTKIAIPPKLPIKNADLCSLLSNILDNAIEYVSTLDKKDRTITFIMQYHEQSLLIQCNNKLLEKDVTLKTKKKDKVNHGYGLSIVKNIAESHKGSMLIETTDGAFSVNVIMALEMEGQNG